MIKVYSKHPLYEISGVLFFSKENNFENEYLSLRIKEERVYTDDVIKILPDINKNYKHYFEWQIRKKSSDNFINYLNKKFTNEIKILEIGCGNGWLINKIAQSNLSLKCIGLDINKYELIQARKNFENDRIDFCYGNIFDDIFIEKSFDVILIASSIQYFKDINLLFDKLFLLLNTSGEIHIIDSPLYKISELEVARLKSQKYYKSIGFEGMSELYFHHSINEFENYNLEIIYNPNIIFNKISSKFLKDKTPFPWIKFKK